MCWLVVVVVRGVGTATAGAALAAPLFSIKKKKKKNGKKVEKGELVSWTTFLLISHNPFYNNPILTYCTNYGLNFLEALASRGLCPLTPTRGSAPCPLDPRWGSHPQTPVLAVQLLNSFRRPWLWYMLACVPKYYVESMMSANSR